MKPEWKEAIEEALRFERGNVESGGHMSHALLKTGTDKGDIMYAFDTDFMSHWRKKGELALHMVVEMFKHGGIMVFTSDSWMAKLPPGKTEAEMPKNLGDWPKEYVQEFIMCCCNQVGERGAFVRQRYKRVEGKIVWEEIAWPGEEVWTSGRFIFDLTDRDPVAAALAIAMYGRDGREKGPVN